MNEAPSFAMSEYESRSKCVEFECQNSGFSREIIVRDGRESTETTRERSELETRAERAGGRLAPPQLV